MALIGYARVSKDEQVTDTQMDELHAVGCAEIFEEHVSSMARARPELAKAMARVRRGDTLVVVRLDRLARSLRDLLEIMAQLRDRGVHFRSLNDPIDTGSPQGEFTLQILGAVAELERKLISQRTIASLKAAKARGRVGGNPQLKARDPAAIRRLSAQRSASHLFQLNATAEEWLPIVRRLRPGRPWREVSAAINASLPAGRPRWTPGRLKRATRTMVDEGLVDAGLLGRATPKVDTHLLTVVAGIVRTDPNATLKEIAGHLTAVREFPTRGGDTWQMSSIRSLVSQARKHGLLDQVVPLEA